MKLVPRSSKSSAAASQLLEMALCRAVSPAKSFFSIWTPLLRDISIMEICPVTEARANAVIPLGFAGLKGKVAARVYREVLNQHIPPILRFGAIFIHDNSLIHTTNIIKDWLQENGIDVKIN